MDTQFIALLQFFSALCMLAGVIVWLYQIHNKDTGFNIEQDTPYNESDSS